MQMIPDWFDEWVIDEPDNWHLKEDAPENIKEEFKAFMEGDVKKEEE